MSRKNPLAELTAKHGLKRCSMGRCCNAAQIELMENNINEMLDYVEYEVLGSSNLVIILDMLRKCKQELDKLRGGE